MLYNSITVAKKIYCPNIACSQHLNPKPENLIKKGLAPGFQGKTYQRFLCKVCGYKFNERQLNWDSTFRKPNRQQLLTETNTRYTTGASVNELRDDLEVHKWLIFKNIAFTAKKILLYQNYLIDSGQFKSNNIVFDEMEHHIHGKHFPVSIGIAYCGDTQRIIAIGVGDLLAKGRLRRKVIRLDKQGKIKLTKKFWNRKNTSAQMCRDIFMVIAKCLGKAPHITTDKKKAYLTYMRNFLPTAQHHQVLSYASRLKKKDPTKRTYTKRQKLAPAGPEQKKALNQLNSLHSKIRKVQGLGRRDQTTFKTNQGMLNALYLFLATYNGYDLNAVLKFKVPRSSKPKKKSAKKIKRKP